MRRLVGTVFLMVCMLGTPRATLAAPSAPPTVKDVALAFGMALVHNDGGMALSLLAPDFRAHTTAGQLPSLLGVSSAPLGAHVVRWQYVTPLGDATLSLRYSARTVAEHLYLRLFTEGWRITNIVPEDPAALRRDAEAAIAAFCDAALHRDLKEMRRQLTSKLAARTTDAQLLSLLGLFETLRSYSIVGYGGTPAGADVYATLHGDTQTLRDRFVVINDRDGWRIAAVAQAG